jgi:hypothetical protein
MKAVLMMIILVSFVMLSVDMLNAVAPFKLFIKAIKVFIVFESGRNDKWILSNTHYIRHPA